MKSFLEKIKDALIHSRLVLVMIFHILLAAASNYFAFVLRFETIPEDLIRNSFLLYLPVLLTVRTVFYFQSGLNKDLWRYASIRDLIKIIYSTTLGSIVFLIIVRHIFGDNSYPRSVYILDWLLLVIGSGGSRLFIRLTREYVGTGSGKPKILLVGAGDAGEVLVRDLRNNQAHARPIGFVDDNPYKKGMRIHGVPIFGPTSMLPELIKMYRPDEIIVSPPPEGGNIKQVYELCKPFNLPIKKLPALSDIISGNVFVAAKLGQLMIDSNLVGEAQVEEALELQRKEGGKLGAKLVQLGHIREEDLFSFLRKQSGLSRIQPISLEDLLQREPVRTDIQSVRNYIGGKTVMITGAGGSIGSELCRQIIRYSPAEMILMDRYENSLFHVDLELRSNGDTVGVSTFIGDIQDRADIEYIFSRHRPNLVFHAAAYKHVPLMEHNPLVAVKNNIFGTKNILEASGRHKVDSFVMISTDKAVNPTSVMGATKRVAEFLTTEMNAHFPTRFVTVRFGNVLGTNGSVVPVFREQLRRGGPLTVTHPDIRRFFMLIPEAVQLVLIASASGKGGEIFVLNMGEPVRIIDLAENFIRLSGFQPHKEIKIKYTGLRPGEKLYEELFDESEEMVETHHDKLRIAVPRTRTEGLLDLHLAELERIVKTNSAEEVVRAIQKVVPSFKGRQAKKTEGKRTLRGEFQIL